MKPRDASYFDNEICKPFFRTGNTTGIVLLHGFTGSVAHMRPLGDALHLRGYSVMGINLPGHATTEDDMFRYGDREWLQAAIDAVTLMHEHCDKVVVCGLSMGAVLSLLMAAQGRVDACISISAPMPAANRWLPLSGFFARLKKRTAWKEDKARLVQLDQKYDKGYSGFPVCRGMDLYHLIQLAKSQLQAITCPVLAIQSTSDTSVALESADTILNTINSVQKEKLVLHDVPHVCTISKELPTITNTIDQFISSIVASSHK